PRAHVRDERVERDHAALSLARSQFSSVVLLMRTEPPIFADSSRSGPASSLMRRATVRSDTWSRAATSLTLSHSPVIAYPLIEERVTSCCGTGFDGAGPGARGPHASSGRRHRHP